MSTSPAALAPTLLQAVAARAKDADVFASVLAQDGRLVCQARESAEEAFYRLENLDGVVTISLVTADRWLSESIEADLLHTGDKIEELVDEELVEQGFEDGPLKVEHFRSDDLLFTFRSRLPDSATAEDDAAVRRAAAVLLAYEAAFRELGDMSESEEL
jgi:hypothetical protein